MSVQLWARFDYGNVAGYPYYVDVNAKVDRELMADAICDLETLAEELSNREQDPQESQS